MADPKRISFFPERNFDFLSHAGDETSRKLRHLIHALDGFLQSGGGLMVTVKGDWGTGKTSILRALQSYYHHHRACPVLFFEAWKYQQEQNPFVPLMHQLAFLCEAGGVAGEWVEAIKRAANAALLISAENFVLSSGAAIKNIRENLELVENLEDRLVQYRVRLDSYFGQIEKIIEKIVEEWQPQVIPDMRDRWHDFLLKEEQEWDAQDRKPFILIIDDLDRCLPEKGFALLEAVRFYLQVKGTLVIAGINDQILIPYIEKVYALSKKEEETKEIRKFFSGADFLEKIFQASFELGLAGFESVRKHYFANRQLPPDGEVFLSGLHLTFRKWVRLSNRLGSLLVSGKEMTPSLVGFSVLQECLPDAEVELRRFPGQRELIEKGQLNAGIEKLITEKGRYNSDVCEKLLSFLRGLKEKG